jgi:hypothetical protein
MYVTDCRPPRRSPWHLISGATVLTLGYLAALLAANWLLR